jgi:hypothetical protein
MGLSENKRRIFDGDVVSTCLAEGWLRTSLAWAKRMDGASTTSRTAAMSCGKAGIRLLFQDSGEVISLEMIFRFSARMVRWKLSFVNTKESWGTDGNQLHDH